MLSAEIINNLTDGLHHNHYDKWVIKDDGVIISQPMLWKTEFKEVSFLKMINLKVDRSEIVLDHFRKHYDRLVDKNGIDEEVKI